MPGTRLQPHARTATVTPHVAGSLEIQRVDGLPALAWLVNVPPGGQRGVAYIGSSVDAWPDALFEGAWAGAFADAEFDQVAFVAGSGARATDDGFLFVPPSHALECLFYIQTASGTTISNSLAFLVAFHELEPEFDRNVGRRFASVVEGLKGYDRVVLETPHGPVKRVMGNNLHLDRHGRTEERPKPVEAEIHGYAAYYRLVSSTIETVFANARHPDRRAAFTPISTCSSGYDSAACTALAAEHGLTEALALGTARSGLDDAGWIVAEHLNVELYICERIAPAAMSTAAEAEFLATGMGGEDVAYASFEPHLARRVLLTGFPGNVWQPYPKETIDLRRMDLSGTSLGEFRLRVGFIHLPVPTIALMRGPEIVRIAHEAEMRPFSVGGSYDKPIPRRIVEEAGVPRDGFGQVKKAASILLHDRPSLMSRDMRARIARLEAEQFQGVRRLAYRLWKLEFWLRYFGGRVLRKVAKVSPVASDALGRLSRRLVGNFSTFEHNNPRSWFDLRAALHLLASRYRV